MAITERQVSIWNDAFLDELEEVRAEFKAAHSADRIKEPVASKEDAAANRRARHRDKALQNHKFEGERYLNCTDKETRRKQLRKLVDEGGQVSCGVGLPSHTKMYVWDSNVLGISDEEVRSLEKLDQEPTSLLAQGWRTAMHREVPWAVAIGTSLVGEGSKFLPEVQEADRRAIEQKRETYRSWGATGDDLYRATALDIEHAGDFEHGRLGADTVIAHVTTDADREVLRRHYILNLHMRTDF